MDERRAIGRRIREARENQGWTQQQLGERYGTTHAAISDIERGVTELGISDILRLAEILGEDVGFFLPESSFQLRHTPGLKTPPGRIKADFIRYVRSLDNGSGREG